jgi:hypothetical protein
MSLVLCDWYFRQFPAALLRATLSIAKVNFSKGDAAQVLRDGSEKASPFYFVLVIDSCRPSAQEYFEEAAGQAIRLRCLARGPVALTAFEGNEVSQSIGQGRDEGNEAIGF